MAKSQKFDLVKSMYKSLKTNDFLYHFELLGQKIDVKIIILEKIILYTALFMFNLFNLV